MANTLLHLFIIGIQYKYGGRFMIPNKFIPGFHNYFKSAQYEAEEVKNECPICLNELRKKP